jgi:inner membrane protein
MASVFGHIMASTALGIGFFPKNRMISAAFSYRNLLILGGFCAFAPDLDILAFNFGIPYGSAWGHRGATHSIVFALFFGILLAAVFYRKEPYFWRIALFLFLCTVSHPLLDACTNGGKGVALFFPFDNTRIFFPWQVIQVSPISPSDFFSDWGLEVLRSEIKWIGIPGVILGFLGRILVSK